MGKRGERPVNGQGKDGASPSQPGRPAGEAASTRDISSPPNPALPITKPTDNPEAPHPDPNAIPDIPDSQLLGCIDNLPILSTHPETEVPDDITVDPNFPLAIDPHEITQQIVQEELDRLDAQKIKNRALEQRQKRAKPHPTDPTPPPPTTVIPSVSQNESPVPDCIPETPLEDLISHPRATTSHIAPPAHVVASSSSPQVSLQKLPAAPDMDHSGWTTYFSSKRKTKSTKVTDTPAPTRAKRRTTSLDRPSSGSRYAPLTHLSDSEEDHHHVAQELKVRTGPVPDFEATPDLEALFPASLLPDAQRFGTEADDLSSPE
ncbi:hypothetical protein NDU88_002641 [Pleurodeles waltl]|uniref:Uncharacterized protein n=1 Tax=Pleurodeles waltl TaxID=8319 RepID=A0AAV7RBK5_PLEWA|nr:hypothetical protein NDU88_002639 [Pleurodeles waltl]KAJ1149841.1 hypothetical protein NDU88_002641 [Pleurodeles waltl]